MSTLATAAVAVAILVGLVGVVVPVLPGAFLVGGAIVVWALIENSAVAWVAASVAVVLLGASQVLKYLVPGRRMRDSGVPVSSVVAGGITGIVGFFVVPVIGLFIGFPAGVYLAELSRVRDATLAWASTRSALHAVGLSILIELAAALLAAATWGGAVLIGA